MCNTLAGETGIHMAEPTSSRGSPLLSVRDVSVRFGGIIALDGVTFDVASYTLKPEFRATLTQVAQSMNEYPNSLIDVYGHTDSTGADDYNLGLSQRRAKSVADVARATGAVVEREIGFGERQPVAPNNSAANMQKNRRVEVVCYRW